MEEDGCNKNICDLMLAWNKDREKSEKRGADEKSPKSTTLEDIFTVVYCYIK